MSAPRIINPATAGGGVPVGGSGAAGYVAKWTAATTLGGSTTTGATASLYVDATGQVGIGTASPANKLTVAGNISLQNSGYLAFSAAAASSANYALYGDTAATVLNGPSSGFIAFDINNIEYARINSAGNVGIGTASPAALLHVNGNQIGGAGASVTPYAQALFGPSSSYTMWWKTNATAGGGIIGTAGPGMQFYVVSGSPNAPTALQVANFDSTGNFILGAATGVSIQAAGTNQGLKLATTPGNTDPNTLDCYKEDTWTPTLSAAASWGGTQPTVSVARYVRIGSTVHCTVVLVGAPNFSSTYLATTITAPFSATYNAAVPISSGATAFGCAQHNAGGTTLFLPTFGVVGAATFSWTFIV